MKLPRYKFIVSVVITEQLGEGVKIAARCLWDAESDNYASDVFLSVSYRFNYSIDFSVV